MKLENQVTSLEISKRLKELGVKQESLFVWAEQQGNPKSNWFLICTDNEINEIGYDGYDDYASAFTVAELGEMLPAGTSVLKRTDIKTNTIARYYVEVVEPQEKWVYDKDSWDENMANALGKMLIYLLENNLLK